MTTVLSMEQIKNAMAKHNLEGCGATVTFQLAGFARTIERAALQTRSQEIISASKEDLREVFKEATGDAAMAAEYQRWINAYHQGMDYDGFLQAERNRNDS